MIDNVHNVHEWAATILSCCQVERKTNAVDLVGVSSFNLQSSAKNLSLIYEYKA
jgi:hypothetical protein